MPSPRRQLGPGRSISRLVLLALVGVLVTSASAAGSADPSIASGTSESPATEEFGTIAVAASTILTAEVTEDAPAEAAEQTSRSDATEATTKSVSLDPVPSDGPFEMNLFEKGDFVKQATDSMCVGSAAQTMINMIDTGDPNRTVTYQKKLYTLARQLSVSQEKLSSSGADPSGWVAALNEKGYGPYVLETANTRAGAMRKAAEAIRETGKPVGLVVWGGRHAWVMSGFTATADPAYTNDFKVTAAHIQDPWYGNSGSIEPNTLVKMSQLKQDFVEYRRGGLYPKREGKYVLVLPVSEGATAAD